MRSASPNVPRFAYQLGGLESEFPIVGISVCREHGKFKKSKGGPAIPPHVEFPIVGISVSREHRKFKKKVS